MDTEALGSRGIRYGSARNLRSAKLLRPEATLSWWRSSSGTWTYTSACHVAALGASEL